MHVNSKFGKYFINDLEDKRSSLVRKNVYFSILSKGLSILISLLLVPLTLDCLSVYEFGVWLTLSSVFTWINYFDIGLGNGLRNRLTESFAEGNTKLGQIYVSTTFFILSIIIIVVFFIFLAVHPFLNWAEILNTDPLKVADLNRVILFSFVLFCINFLFKIIGIVYTAAQKPAFNDLITFLGSLLSLVIIFILKQTTGGTLMRVALTFSAAPVLVLLAAYPVTFYKYFKGLCPRWSSVKLYHARNLMNLGTQFFLLQISGLIIFGTSNLIISRTLGPEQVTPYNIVFKYFSIATMSFNIIITPLWSASTDAFAKGDLNWIKRSMNGMIKISMISTAVVLLLVFASNLAYRIWIGNTISIPFKLTFWMGLYTVVIVWSTCFSTFLFGFGKLRVQLLNTLFVSILFIPLALWFSKALGSTGIVIALILTNLSGALLNPIQYRKIISGKAEGIWNR